MSFQGGTLSDGTLTNNSATAYDGQSGTVSAVLAGSAGLNVSTAGTLALSGNNTYSGGTSVNNGGTLTVNGGVSNGGPGAIYVGTGGAAATMNVNGASTAMTVGGNVGIGQTTAGTLNLNNGTLAQTAGNLVVGNSAAGTLNQSGGSLNYAVSAGHIYLGNTANSPGTWTQTGGTATLTSNNPLLWAKPATAPARSRSTAPPP